jgi:hypothetical protein
MLDGFQRYLEDRAAQNDRRSLQEAVKVVAGANRSSTVWRRLLAIGTQYPTRLGVLLAPLAWATPILAGLATASAARPFVHAVFSLLDAADRARVEQAILALPAAAPERDPDWITAARNRLLDGLDRAHLTTDEARALRSELDAEKSVPGAAPPPTAPLPDAETPTTERRLRAAGVDLTAEATQPILELVRPVETFLEVEPTAQQSVDIVASLQSLLAALTATVPAQLDPAVSARAWELASRAASQLAQADDISCDNPDGQSVRELLLAASRHLEPVAGDKEDLEANTILSWTTAPRTSAAEGLMTLAGVPTCADAQLLEAIERLASDPAPRVRHQIARDLNRLYQTAQPRMWALARQFAHEEPTSGVLHALVKGALGMLGRVEPEQVAKLLAAIYRRTQGGNVHLDEACLSLLTVIWAGQGTPEAGQALEQAAQQELSADRLGHVLYTLRSGLTYGATEAADPAADQVRERSFRLLSQLVVRARDTLAALQATWRATQPSDEDNARAREAASILDIAMRELYFASGAYDREASPANPSRASLTVHERFYREAHDLLDQMAEIQLPSVTHHLVETLQFFVPLDPRGVFLCVDRAVTEGGQQGGYQLEPLAVDLVVGLIRRYLADYRELLHQDADCRRALQRILDIFVAVGWPEARRLTYQLDDIFR